MKRFNAFIKGLSLTQQLFMLIFFFVSFFAAFFFVYINNSIEDAIKEQIFESLDNTQQTLLSASTKNEIHAKAGNISSYTISAYYDTNNDLHLVLTQDLEDGSIIDDSSEEWKQIYSVIPTMMKTNPTIPYHGIVNVDKQQLDTYYSLLKINDNQFLLSMTYSDNMHRLESMLVNSVVYITVIVVGFFFIILMLWVITLIHPLNQIRNYIERVKLGKEAVLHVNRKDEIGELADALVSMREELLRQEKTKEEMIHNISHDLKTPIATIKSYGESIKDGIYPYETLEKSVDVIIENADRLEQKVHSLLFMNRVEYLISQDSEGTKSNMKEIIEMVVQNIKVIKPEIKIQTNLDEVLFDGLEEPWRVVVENIMENALRYANTTIEIQLHQDTGLTIENDGPSLDESRIKTLFKPYEMGQGGRFGLGLSIVSKVVSANGYTVIGENTARGVIFRIKKKEI